MSDVPRQGFAFVCDVLWFFVSNCGCALSSYSSVVLDAGPTLSLERSFFLLSLPFLFLPIVITIGPLFERNLLQPSPSVTSIKRNLSKSPRNLINYGQGFLHIDFEVMHNEKLLVLIL